VTTAYRRIWMAEGTEGCGDLNLEPCAHDHVELDDDGLINSWYVCLDCNREVYLTEPDEDGQSFWEVTE